MVTVYADGTMIHIEDDWREIRVGGAIAKGQRMRRAPRQAVAELRKQRRGTKREALRKPGVYLKNNAPRIDYPRYREQGLPVGSGPVESMCKALVGGRCKQAGMRKWTRQGAEAVLRLRAAQFDRDFRALWGSPPSPSRLNPPQIVSRTGARQLL